MADAAVSKTAGGNPVRVRLPPSAPYPIREIGSQGSLAPRPRTHGVPTGGPYSGRWPDEEPARAPSASGSAAAAAGSRTHRPAPARAVAPSWPVSRSAGRPATPGPTRGVAGGRARSTPGPARRPPPSSRRPYSGSATDRNRRPVWSRSATFWAAGWPASSPGFARGHWTPIEASSFGHPSGRLDMDVALDAAGVRRVGVYRTARRLWRGEVFIPDHLPASSGHGGRATPFRSRRRGVCWGHREWWARREGLGRSSGRPSGSWRPKKGPLHTDVRVRVYLPARHCVDRVGRPRQRAARNFHGGGWTIGDLNSHDRICRRLAGSAAVAVLAADYRRAPEDPWPAAVDDAITVVRWAREHATTLTGDRPIGVCGDSAGGNIAARCCLRLKDSSEPQPAVQASAYPNTDLTFSQSSVSKRRRVGGWTPTMLDGSPSNGYPIRHCAPILVSVPFGRPTSEGSRPRSL